MAYAQTNLQLFNQMRERGYSDDDLAIVRRAYTLATQLFTSEYRGSGKPLLAHLVGTASVLVSLKVRVALVGAAVVHAAYIFGEFGDGRRGSDPAKRSKVRDSVGEEIEALVMHYQQLRWQSSTVAAISARVKDMPPDERDVLLIRLANELEDHLDLGVLYCGNAERRRQDIRSTLYRCVDMSRALGQPLLAAELQRAFDEVLSTDVPEALRSARDWTYAIPPLSHAPTFSVSLRRIVDAHPRLGLMLHPGRLVSRMSNGGKREAAAPPEPGVPDHGGSDGAAFTGRPGN
jgi:(p)ppGpp synthase/HD superfamily hydrolase